MAANFVIHEIDAHDETADASQGKVFGLVADLM